MAQTLLEPEMLAASLGSFTMPADVRLHLMHSTDPSRRDEHRWAARVGMQEFWAFAATAADAVRSAAERFNDGLENGDYGNGPIPKIRRR